MVRVQNMTLDNNILEPKHNVFYLIQSRQNQHKLVYQKRKKVSQQQH
jgi:hypothetical protein